MSKRVISLGLITMCCWVLFSEGKNVTQPADDENTRPRKYDPAVR